jgi:GTP-binding protein EngB required for normal cell division
MPTTPAISEDERSKIDEELEAYLKDNKEISDAIEVMKQAASVRNRDRYLIEPIPYRSVRMT